MGTINDFFIPENTVNYVSEDAYSQALPIIRTIEAMARLNNNSIYIIDFYKKNFLFVSGNPLFLCGFKPEEVKNMGYSFYFNQIPEKEIQLLIKINKAGFDFYSKIPIVQRLQLSISYDFDIINHGKNILINHKLTPILLADNGNIWLACCQVSLSSNQQPGNIEAQMEGNPNYWSYSMKTCEWAQLPNILLTDREKEALHLSIQNYDENGIADKMCVDKQTVKFHKQSLFAKFNVKSIAAAIAVAIHRKVI